jgi:diamine N-acetyltransferase
VNYLENENIKLRAPEPSDLDLLYEWENNTETWIFGTTLTPFSKHLLSKYIETAHLDLFEASQLRLMIDLKKEKMRTIGTIDLFDFDSYHRRAGVGILIAEKTDHGKGYATEALQILIIYCFELLGVHQLYCNIGADNKASLNLFKNQGFEIVGLKKEWMLRGKKFTDEYLLQLINKD